jgi:hypothetical protein
MWFVCIALVLCTSVATARPLLAQHTGVALTLPDQKALATTAPAVRTIDVITSSHTAELIRNGFPARLHYKLERWAAGTFVNRIKATTEWEMIVEYDALAKIYRVIRVTADSAVVLGEYDSLSTAAAKVAEPYRPKISLPKRGEKTYYVVTLDVEAMSLSDLDEVRRWLRGELRPAMRGKRNPGTAVTTGIRTLFVRIMGGERIRYQANTGVFRP